MLVSGAVILIRKTKSLNLLRDIEQALWPKYELFKEL